MRLSLLGILMAISITSQLCEAQSIAMFMNPGNKSIEIPFTYENHFIVIDVLYEKFLPLKFIFDTGAEHTVLTKREISNLMGTPYERQILIRGADYGVPLFAYISRKVKLRVGETNITQDILVLQDDYFKFEEYAGVEIHGILGAEVFRGMVVEINYDKKKLIITPPEHFKPPKKHLMLPIEIWHNKPYINTRIKLYNDSIINARLLIDTGAGLSLLLNASKNNGIQLPPNTITANIGVGIGGALTGVIGRIKSFSLGPYAFDNLISNFQSYEIIDDSLVTFNRDGIIGDDILNRFVLTIDFANSKLYLYPNDDFNKKIEYDKSGLSFIATGPSFKTFIINDVITNSPAADLGLQKGDELYSLNGIGHSFLSLYSIQNRFSGKAGKTIKFSIKRNGKKQKMRMILRDLI